LSSSARDPVSVLTLDFPCCWSPGASLFICTDQRIADDNERESNNWRFPMLKHFFHPCLVSISFKHLNDSIIEINNIEISNFLIPYINGTKLKVGLRRVPINAWYQCEFDAKAYLYGCICNHSR
jgi:hypothetical protein